MKRPTRVPASTVVRMNRASNMIAKWYQKARRPSPVAPAKIVDMPTASVGRAAGAGDEGLSSTLRAAASSAPGRDREAEAVDGLATPTARSRRRAPAGAFIA